MPKDPKFRVDNNMSDTKEQLISKSAKVNKKKNKINNGKVGKKSNKKKDKSSLEEKLKEEVMAILNNSEYLNSSLKVPTKRKKPKINNTDDYKENPIIVDKKSEEPKKKKKKRKKITKEETLSEETTKPMDYKERKREKLKQKLQQILHPAPEPKKQKKVLSLRERMMQRLQAARFRYINEEIYSTDSKEAQKMFHEDPDAFKAYHEGYRQQVNKWPLNPLDVIIRSVQKLPKTYVVADFGCGEAKLAESVNNKVHSFDLVAMNESVTACDMAHVPLENNSVDVVVFCLSLMGTNLHEYILEANRILKIGGVLKVAEVESRFQDVNQFIEGLKRFNFKITWQDLSHNLFYFLDFKKEGNIKNKKKLPTISLYPCLYKKR